MLDVIKKLFPYALDDEGEDKYALEDEGEDKESSQDESEESSNDTDDSEDEKEPGDTSSFDMIDDVAICHAVTKLKRDLRGMKLVDGTCVREVALRKPSPQRTRENAKTRTCARTLSPDSSMLL